MDIRICPPCDYASPPPAVECPHCGSALEVRDERWLIGQTLGSYRIECILGSGGMGVVFGARHQALLREAAIKVLQPGLGSGGDCGESAEAFARRFLHEARLLASLDHPGIVGIYDFAVAPFGFPYLVMPRLRGETLRELLRRHPEGLAPSWVAAIVQDLCEALGYAHGRGVVHRDLKPENVFLGADAGLAWTRLLDFGIAHSPQRDGLDQTRTGMLLGTPLYLAPEQLRGERVSAATDQYSLALLVIELLDGRAVRAGESLTAIMRRYASTPLPPTALPQRLDPAQLRALRRATDPQPDARFPDLAGFRAALGLPEPDRIALAEALCIAATKAAAAPAAQLTTPAPTLQPPATLPASRRPPAAPQVAPAARRDSPRRRVSVRVVLLIAACVALLIGLWQFRQSDPSVPAPAPAAGSVKQVDPASAGDWLRPVDAMPLPGALAALAQVDQSLVLRQAGGWMLLDMTLQSAAPGAALARGERLVGADDQQRLWLLHDAQIDALDPGSGRRETVATFDPATPAGDEDSGWTLSADGRWLARIQTDRVTVFRVAQGQAQVWMEREVMPATRVALGSRSLALAGPRGQLEVWNLDGRQRLWQRELQAFRVNVLRLSEPLGRLALATEEAIEVYSLDTGAAQGVLATRATDLLWFDDGPRLASVDGRRLRLWEWRDGAPVQAQEVELRADWLFRGRTHLICGGEGMLHRFAFGPRLAPIDAGVGSVWSAAAFGGYAYLGGSAPQLARLAPQTEVLHRQLHDAGVPDLRVHDGRLVSASDDRTLAAWRLPELEPLWRARGHEFMINQIGVGGALWTASSDGSLRRWRWPELEPDLDIALRARVDPQLELHALWVAADDAELLVGTWNHRLLRLRRDQASWALASAPLPAHTGYRMLDLPDLHAVLVVGIDPGRLTLYDRRDGTLVDLPDLGRDCMAGVVDGSGRGAWLGCSAALVRLRLLRAEDGGFAAEAAYREASELGVLGALALLPASGDGAPVLVAGNDVGQALFLPIPTDLPFHPLGQGAAPRGFVPLR